MRIFHRRPSPALLISVIALFAAVGGGYAIGAGKIGTGDIAKQAVTNKKIAKKTIKKSRVADDTLTGKQIDEGSLGTVPAAEVAGTGRSIFQDFAIQIPGTSGSTEALSLDVPAGSYLFIAKTVLQKGPPTHVQCSTSAGGDSDESIADVSAPPTVTLVNTVVHTFDAPGSAVLSCNNPSPGLLLLTNTRITAIPFADLENVAAP